MRGHDVPSDFIAQEGTRRRHDLLREAVGDVSVDAQQAYGLLLGLGSHDLSAMRELVGRPHGVLHAAQRRGGQCVVATFDYGDFVCHYETGVDNIPRFDAHLEVYGQEHVLRLEYDTPFIRNLPIRLSVLEANQHGGTKQLVEHPCWGDPFVAQWEAFHTNVVEGRNPKTSPEDFRQDLELFRDMMSAMSAISAMSAKSAMGATSSPQVDAR